MEAEEEAQALLQAGVVVAVKHLCIIQHIMLLQDLQVLQTLAELVVPEDQLKVAVHQDILEAQEED